MARKRVVPWGAQPASFQDTRPAASLAVRIGPLQTDTLLIAKRTVAGADHAKSARKRLTQMAFRAKRQNQAPWCQGVDLSMIKLVLCGLLLSIPANKAYAQSYEEVYREQSVLHSSPADLFRDYALVACLALAAPQLGWEVNAAANGYVQYGEGPIEIYREVTVVAYHFLKRDYANVGEGLGFMKCNDFARSRALTAIIRKYATTFVRSRASKLDRR